MQRPPTSKDFTRTPHPESCPCVTTIAAEPGARAPNEHTVRFQPVSPLTHILDETGIGLEGVRRQIVDQLQNDTAESTVKTWYGLAINIDGDLADQCIEDRDGDKLDSVLCALQAAWAYWAPNYGMPAFASTVLQEVVALEGWVADPFLDKWTSPARHQVEAMA